MSLLLGDCLEVMAGMPECSVDAIVTDPPYELGFMGKGWDKAGIAFDKATWEACHRVLKPGGHLIAFGGSRTHHRIWCAIEDAGFEVRDTLMWVYGSGFPKSLDVSKALDKMAGAEREVVGRYELPDVADGRRRKGWECTNTTEAGVFGVSGQCAITAPATEAARQWDGWGTALKPAYEPIVLARKPFPGSVASNVLAWGTGAINVDGCRIAHNEECRMMADQYGDQPSKFYRQGGRHGACLELKPSGRWPANLLLDEEAAAMLDEQSGTLSSGGYPPANRQRTYNGIYGKPNETKGGNIGPNTGGASRFFYCAKASRSERGEDNGHPTVKPLALMRWLVSLVTPPGGTVLDPFMGSGSTGCAVVQEGFEFVGIEREAEYLEIAKRRIAYWTGDALPLFAEVTNGES